MESGSVFGVFALFLAVFLVIPSKVPTASMENTVLAGDKLLVNKFVFGEPSPFISPILPQRKIRRGDLAVFTSPSNPGIDFVKRVVAVGGDLVFIKDKVLYINREKQDEPYASFEDEKILPGARDNFGPIEVTEGYCFVMGDNRDNSMDSRFIGFIPEKKVKGRAFVVVWSVEGPEGAPAGLREGFERWSQYLLHFFTATRWGRIFTFV